MKIFSIVLIVLKAIIIPYIVLLTLNKFNIFEFVTIVPSDYAYEVGLTFYLALSELIYALIKNYIDQRKVIIKCVFYISEEDEDIKSTPTIVCDRCIGVAAIKCHLSLSGNLKRLRNVKIVLNLPSWLTSQVSKSDTVLQYFDNQLCWQFDELLPNNGTIDQFVEYKCNLSFIKNMDENTILIKLEPQVKNNFGVTFQTNCFKIQNGER